MAKKYSSSKNAYDCNDSVNEADTNKASSKNSAKNSSKNSYSSESSKNDIVKLLNVPEDNIDIVNPAYDKNIFKYSNLIW